ncbi:5-methylthioadenosine phosphorylase, putative [Babesia ovata]|uniref:5-methylthioadenosine phosphorylase, putative n=1 Tax=Babesia ovata TaxID=189622 RepID=A0A2H6KHI4_9APIC|nr:5-methylthioadenosine phosphorylase, putative [Babesia ovata]GBE62450.1 5-methylthioadenosine phosphorylase, putative [Babesia ovata]
MRDNVTDGRILGTNVPEGTPSARSCALVYAGDEALAVVHAMSLLGAVLNCLEELRDKRGLLICKRTSWDAAVALLGRSLSDNFDSCITPCSALHELYESNCTTQSSLEKLFGHAFRVGSSVLNAAKQSEGWDMLNDVIDGQLCSQLSNASMHTSLTQQNAAMTQAVGDTQKQTYTSFSGGNTIYRSMQRILAMERSRENTLDRLLVRFVDQIPLESTSGKRSSAFNPFVEPGLEMKWNYIQAANEMCDHPPDIGVTVVAGLSHMNLIRHNAAANAEEANNSDDGEHRISSNSSDVKSNPTMHPFDGSDRFSWDDEGKRQSVRLRSLKSYTFCIALTLNALNVNLTRLATPNGWLPKLFMIEPLPSKNEDQQQFVGFLRSRFQFLYRLE